MKDMRILRGISMSFAIGFLLLLMCSTLSAQEKRQPIRNIVLVHGAWADGSGWKGVYEILVKDGFRVSIVQEPETTFKDDVAATRRAPRATASKWQARVIASMSRGRRKWRS